MNVVHVGLNKFARR